MPEKGCGAMLKVIYQPKGRALEYSPWAANLYRGCGHSCEYCYAPSALRMTPDEFSRPTARVGIIDKLAHDASELQSYGQQLKVLLCFSCDCFQPLNSELGLARQAIEALHFYGQSVVILTKGGYRALPDIPLLRQGDEFAVTLTCDNEADSMRWESNAAPPQERIDTLMEAKARGVYTWVSLEPVLYPEQSLALITRTHEFVDFYKLGVLNYHLRANEINWGDYGNKAVAELQKLGKGFYIKADLKKYL